MGIGGQHAPALDVLGFLELLGRVAAGTSLQLPRRRGSSNFSIERRMREDDQAPPKRKKIRGRPRRDNDDDD